MLYGKRHEPRWFEKSLYDLIRGLRNHKGNEREYILNSLRECRTEIRGQDMDVKATALLKLIYLEMFGHDMSWASFHVLEVMSSAKYAQKRVGYLGAVQSIRPDTEVLMLATNLLKKDLSSPSPTTMSLPILTLPHITTPSLSLSLLPDLLPRLSHSQPAIRKKTIVTLYRLALVYPETLRAAWPKIKERLMDESEDSSVTAAIVNVVCELGWRRPQDFLPLAPRLFDLLVDGGNNWMAIKIIKLFATLTPLEPRLVKKLLPPLMSIIRTTPAMSLLYECINGIIQGGILDSVDGTSEGEEIASLCVGKLRGMIVVEGDPNLKYVALLAFNKIVASHPHLVALQHDVILDCVDDADITIRLRALDLVVGMVTSDNLMSVVGRLMRQLRSSPSISGLGDSLDDRAPRTGVEPAADPDDEDAEESLKPGEKRSDQPPPLPDDYKFSVIQRILEMCSRDMYANVVDFEWYIDVLVQLAKLAPATGTGTLSRGMREPLLDGESGGKDHDIPKNIGSELRNVAVRVREVRPQATRAAETLIKAERRDGISSASNGGRGVLTSAVWIVGEYADLLLDRSGTLSSLLNPSTSALPAETLSICLQAIPKVFSSLVGTDRTPWTPERKAMTALLAARVIHFLEPLAAHPNLEVQERAVEFLELIKLAAEAISGQQTSTANEDFDAPLLLSQAIPTLFAGFELNPVAPGAQRKVPLPAGLDLDMPINQGLQSLLSLAEFDPIMDNAHDDFGAYYNDRPAVQAGDPAINALNESISETQSYQQGGDENYLDPAVLARRRAERKERNKDDPFYIGDGDPTSGTSSPLHSILKNDNGDGLDIDAIPIMKLDLGNNGLNLAPEALRKPVGNRSGKPVYEIGADENIVLEGDSPDRENLEEPEANLDDTALPKKNRGRKGLLQVDSSGLGTLSLTGNDDQANDGLIEIRRLKQEEEQMAKALRDVERLRLEMQRASERIQAAKGVPPEGTLVKKKKKGKVTDKSGNLAVTGKSTKGKDGQDQTVPKKKRKKPIHSNSEE